MKTKAVLFLSALLGWSSIAIAQPSNDMFANAQLLSGSLVQVSGSTTGATREVGEFDGSFDDSTVWYRWIAPRKGDLLLSVVGSEYLAFWIYQRTGVRSVLGLTYVYGDDWDDTINLDARRFNGGEDLYIRVSSSDPASFTMLLNFSPVYESSIALTTRGRSLKAKGTIRGRVSNPADVSSIRVNVSGAGRAGKVRFNKAKGTFSFKHSRKGPPPRKGRSKQVTYTVTPVYAGAAVGEAVSKTWRVR